MVCLRRLDMKNRIEPALTFQKFSSLQVSICSSTVALHYVYVLVSILLVLKKRPRQYHKSKLYP